MCASQHHRCFQKHSFESIRLDSTTTVLRNTKISLFVILGKLFGNIRYFLGFFIFLGVNEKSSYKTFNLQLDDITASLFPTLFWSNKWHKLWKLELRELILTHYGYKGGCPHKPFPSSVCIPKKIGANTKASKTINAWRNTNSDYRTIAHIEII